MFDKSRELTKKLTKLNDFQREILYSSINVHGHICGGMPLGFLAGLAALEKLGIERERNMDSMLVVYVGNNHAAGCFVDGLQFATGCTFGKGLLKKEPKGKWEFLLINKKNGEAVRGRIKNEIIEGAFNAPFMSYRRKGVNPTDVPEDATHDVFLKILSTDYDKVVEIDGPFKYEIVRKKPCFKIVKCSRCGMYIAENYISLEDGTPVCLDCFQYGR